MHTTHHHTPRGTPSVGAAAAAAGCRQRLRSVRCRCDGSASKKKVVVLGGTGRVGSATAASLLQNLQQYYDVTVASRSQQSFDKILEIRPGLKGARFAQCDITDKQSVKAIIAGADLVLHTAGPFQHSSNYNVIEAALETQTPYIDVCDDTHYSEGVKAYHDQAVAAGIPALTTAGIYPGTSNVMAAHMYPLSSRGDDNDNGKSCSAHR